MNTTNKTAVEEKVEELRNKYKLKDNTIYCSDDSEFCNDIKQALNQAHQQERQNIKAQLIATHPDKLTEVIKNL